MTVSFLSARAPAERDRTGDYSVHLGGFVGYSNIHRLASTLAGGAAERTRTIWEDHAQLEQAALP